MEAQPLDSSSSHSVEFELRQPRVLAGTRVHVHRSDVSLPQQLTVRYRLRPCTQSEFSLVRSYLLQSTREHLANAGRGVAVLGAHSSEPGRVFRLVLVATDVETSFHPAGPEATEGPWWWTARLAGPCGEGGAARDVPQCGAPRVLETRCIMQGDGICVRMGVRHCPGEPRHLRLDCERNVLLGMSPQSDVEWDDFVERMGRACRRWPRVDLSSRNMLEASLLVHSAQDIVGLTRGYAVVCTEDGLDAVLPLRQLFDRAAIADGG